MPRARPKAPKTGATEKQVSEQVQQAAAMLGLELKRRNVGGMTTPSGRYVPFNEAGDSDWTCMIERGPHRGKIASVEIKHEYFDPAKVRGEERRRFEGQLAKLRRANEQGSVGFWVDSGPAFLAAMRRVLEGWRVEIAADGYPWLVSPDEPRPGGRPGKRGIGRDTH